MRSHSLLLLTVMPGAIVSAQTSGGGIGGTITGPSGASVAGAAILIEEVDTGSKWKLVSSSTGLYSAHSFPVGKDSVLVNPSGFAIVKRESVEVEEGSERLVDVQLASGQSSQTVIVNSEAADLDSATSQVAAVYTGHVVRELPLNGRDWGLRLRLFRIRCD
jgi:hypothetical protein